MTSRTTDSETSVNTLNPSLELADTILEGVNAVIMAGLEANQPLEVEPARSRLFELFVMAEGAGFLAEGGAVDLTSDELCRRLAARWKLDVAARESVAKQEKIPVENVAQMRALWSVLRMWMEWTYAWSRWTEFHSAK
ncbi:MAG: hypothetical protein R3C01_05705 [Planctomycetaceae bacterium]